MARIAHTLNLTPDGLSVRVALWIAVKESLRHLYRQPGAPNLAMITMVEWATAAEREQLARGEMIERVIDVPIPTTGTPTQRRAAMQATIAAARVDAQAEISAQQPHPYYGYVFDGTDWTPI